MGVDVMEKVSKRWNNSCEENSNQRSDKDKSCSKGDEEIVEKAQKGKLSK